MRDTSSRRKWHFISPPQENWMYSSVAEKMGLGADLSRKTIAKCWTTSRSRGQTKRGAQFKITQTTPKITFISFCFVAVSQQIQWRSRSCNSSTSGTMGWISAELWKPRAKPRDSVKAQWLTLSIPSAVSEVKALNICTKHAEGCNVGNES